MPAIPESPIETVSRVLARDPCARAIHSQLSEFESPVAEIVGPNKSDVYSRDRGSAEELYGNERSVRLLRQWGEGEAQDATGRDGNSKVP